MKWITRSGRAEDKQLEADHEKSTVQGNSAWERLASVSGKRLWASGIWRGGKSYGPTGR